MLQMASGRAAKILVADTYSLNDLRTVLDSHSSWKIGTEIRERDAEGETLNFYIKST